MTNEELVDIAKQASERIASRSSHRSPEDAAMREAAIVVLCERDLNDRQIADLVGLSNQRVSALISRYYKRIEKEWEERR